MDWMSYLDFATLVPAAGAVVALVTLQINYRQLLLAYQSNKKDGAKRREEVFERCRRHYADLGVYPFGNNPNLVPKTQWATVLRDAKALTVSEKYNPDSLALAAYCYLMMREVRKATRCAKGALASDPEHREALKVLLNIAIEGKQHRRAASLVKKCLRLYPESPDFICAMAQLCKAKGDLAQARTYAEQSIALDEHYYPPYRLMISICKEQQEHENMEDWLLRAKSLFPDSKELLGWLVIFYVSRGNESATTEIFEKIGQSENNTVYFALAELMGASPAAVAASAQQALDRLRGDEAMANAVASGLAYCSLQLKQNPMDVLALHIYGMLQLYGYIRTGDHAQLIAATSTLEKASSLAAKYDIFSNLATCYLWQNRLEETKEALLKSAMALLGEGAPGAAGVYLDFVDGALAFPVEGADLKADVFFEEVLKDCIRHFPDFSPAYRKLGEYYRSNSRWDDEYQIRKQLVANSLVDSKFAINFVQRAIERRQWDDAQSVVENIDEGEFYSKALFCRGVCMFGRSDYTAGNQLVNQAYALGYVPDEFDFEMLGHVFYDDQNFVDAAAVFSRALEKNPDNYLHHSWKGSSLLMLSRYEEAIVALLKAESMNGDDEQVLRDLAHCHDCLGRGEKAIEYYKKMLKLNPASEEAREKIDKYFQPRHVVD